MTAPDRNPPRPDGPSALFAAAMLGTAALTLTVASAFPPSEVACFGARNGAHAQRGAEVWLRTTRAAPAPRNAQVQCLPMADGGRWAECHLGPTDPGGTRIVLDCDTAERHNIGCVRGR